MSDKKVILTVKGVKGKSIDDDTKKSGCKKGSDKHQCGAYGFSKTYTGSKAGYSFTQTSDYKDKGCSGQWNSKTHYQPNCRKPTSTCQGSNKRKGVSRGWMFGDDRSNKKYKTKLGGGIWCEYDASDYDAQDIHDLNQCTNSAKGSRDCAYTGDSIDDPTKVFDPSNVLEVMKNYCLKVSEESKENGVCPFTYSKCKDAKQCDKKPTCFNYMKTAYSSSNLNVPYGQSVCANFMKDPKNAAYIESVLNDYCTKDENIGKYECDCIGAFYPGGRLHESYEMIVKNGISKSGDQCWFLPCRDKKNRIIPPSKYSISKKDCPAPTCENIQIIEKNTDWNGVPLSQSINCHPSKNTNNDDNNNDDNNDNGDDNDNDLPDYPDNNDDNDNDDNDDDDNDDDNKKSNTTEYIIIGVGVGLGVIILGVVLYEVLK